MPFLIAAVSLLAFNHPKNHRSETLVNEYNTLGERCSGTSFVDALIKANFTTVKRSQRFAHKHFFPWFDLPESREFVLPPWKIDENAFLQDSDNNFFVLVVRNHEDWLRSFYFQPFYVPNINKNNGFLHFIANDWKIDLQILARDYYRTLLPEGWTFKWPYELENGYYDSNVYQRRDFKNIFELRSYKMRNYLQIGSKVQNFIVLKYEDVREDPEGCINFISEYFCIPKCEPFVPVIK